MRSTLRTGCLPDAILTPIGTVFATSNESGRSVGRSASAALRPTLCLNCPGCNSVLVSQSPTRDMVVRLSIHSVTSSLSSLLELQRGACD